MPDNPKNADDARMKIRHYAAEAAHLRNRAFETGVGRLEMDARSLEERARCFAERFGLGDWRTV